MGRAPYFDLYGNARMPSGYISETETVWTTLEILTKAELLPVPSEGDLPSATYFDMAIETQPGVPPAAGQVACLPISQQSADKLALANFLAFADSAPTFRKLIRLAAFERRLPIGGPSRWAVTVVGPLAGRDDGTALYAPMDVDLAARVISVPLRDIRPIGNQFYLFKGGNLMPMGVVCQAVRAFVRALVGVPPRDTAAWLGADYRVDPRRIATQGADERGVVDYLAQRILKEVGLGEYGWVSPLSFTLMDDIIIGPGSAPPIGQLSPAMHAAFNQIGGIEALETYVERQDQYLEHVFPIG
jgi:hypothetical protein